LRVQRYTFFLNLQRFFAKKCFFLSVLAKKMLFDRILDGFFVEFARSVLPVETAFPCRLSVLGSGGGGRVGSNQKRATCVRFQKKN
jgi:hypothetical protein